MRHLIRKNFEYWTHVRSLKALLVYICISIFVWMPLSHGKMWELVIQDILFNLMLLSGVFAVFSYRWQHTVFVILALGAFVFRWWVFLSDSSIIKLADNIVSLFYFILLSIFVLRIVFKDGPVNTYRILGALVFYLTFGMICAYVYNLIYLFDDQAFVFQANLPDTRFFDTFLYFSFVIQTTLGIGDIAPVNPFAKSLVIFQAMMGMLYPVIMIARLIALEIEHTKETRAAG